MFKSLEDCKLASFMFWKAGGLQSLKVERLQAWGLDFLLLETLNVGWVGV